jgi:hypothetical protein
VHSLAQQQLATRNPPDSTYLNLSDEEERERLAEAIIAELDGWTYPGAAPLALPDRRASTDR